TAIVEYDYTAKEPDELDLVKGAIIHSIKQMPGGWWEGTLQSNGKTGMFPDNFVRVVDMNEDNTVVLRDKTAASNRRCKVIYSYTQVNDDELSLAVGDVIEFLGEVEEGWWRGRLKNKIGVFPSNFVKLIESSPVFASKRPPSQTTAAATSATKSANNTAAATSSTISASATSAASAAAATKQKINRLSFHNSKEDLLSNTANSTTSSGLSNITVATSIDDAAPSLPPKPQREYCRVEFPYAPQNDDELELKVGDIITIHSMDLPDKGWWKGELRGKIGVFPDNFVKLMAPSEVSPLNDPQQQSQPQQSHRTTAKLSNQTTANVAATTTATNNTATSNVKSLIKKSGSSSSTQSSNRKDSFGSRDSLNDILSETGLPSGNVAAQRKSLENKNLDLTNASDVASRLAYKKQQLHMQQQQESKTITSSISSNITTATSSTSSTLLGGSSSATINSSELRKSTESMDEKTKTTPPPVLNKKPTVPVKKTTTVTSITGNILSGIKQKVKNVENKLTTAASHDYADGVGSSKLSPSYATDSGSAGGGVIMRRAATIAVEDTDFDRVERSSILPDMRAGRVKAPKRRPPSAAINAIGESNNNSLYINGNSSDTTQSGDDQLKSDDNSTGEEQLAKPKPREWEKKKAPWMEELKASQVKKKTSPSVADGTTSSSSAITERNSKLFTDDVKITNNTTTNTSSQVTSSMQATNSTTTSSSSSSATKVQSSSVSSTSLMQQSMLVESSSSSNSTNTTNTTTAKTLTEAMTKSLSAKIANDVMASVNHTSLNNTTNSNCSTANVIEDVRARPNSLSIRNRSASPSMSATRNILKSNTTTTAASSSTITNSASPADAIIAHNSANLQNLVAKTTNSTSGSSSTSNNANSLHNNHVQNNNGGSQNKISELETRVDKLEMLVHAQQRTIDELVRTLREETDRNKVLRAELDKYAQCVTQV
ncbi:hypothetical protein DOY81_005726, partial [Sarcophaga bullata]